jgi:Putative Ig domain
VGQGPDALSCDGTHVWVANGGDSSLTEIIAFGIAPVTLPPATPGQAYGPIALQAVGVGTSSPGYTTTLKWKGGSLPKGLKLNTQTGALSGRPSEKLKAGQTSIKVKVTESVTTVVGAKKTVAKTTASATIPLTIT